MNSSFHFVCGYKPIDKQSEEQDEDIPYVPNPIQFVLLREFTHLHKKWVMSIHIE